MVDRAYKSYPYNDRESRNRFVADDFDMYIQNKVLNVGGGGKKHLFQYLSGDIEYLELDLAGEPDYRINLEQELPIPVEDQSFDTVICTDVLEHLDNFHAVFKELLRVSRKYVVLSLPNAVASARSYYMDRPESSPDDIERRRQFGYYSKFYGLPFDRPVDRHKWFFSYTEAEDFINHHVPSMGFQVKEVFGIGYYTHKITGRVLRGFIQIILGDDARKNIFNQTFWCVLERR